MPSTGLLTFKCSIPQIENVDQTICPLHGFRLISIALALFFGLFFGLSGLRNSITRELSTIKETVIAIQGTAEKTWDLILRHFPAGGGTVVRELENLGKVRITAEPGKDETSYLIEIEKPILREGLLIRASNQPEFQNKEKEFFGEQWKRSRGVFLSPTRTRYYLPSTDPKSCTGFVTFMLQWLNSTYVDSLKDVKEFEEPILS